MEVGILEIDISIGGIRSLKEKRKILKSTITRLKNKFNLSVAEVGYHDKWQRATLGVAAVSTDKRYLDKILQKSIDMLEKEGHFELIDYQMYFW
ncbi:DUF503 domain-containing protein [Natranaerobius thermophilus]|uniref:YlxP-like protein n=1 Tax=Natranaerobius thermophilus (strain ATCC BAA-1301 / DSM 18059 / JW/NM-WN-LF) TaxID=457570 RepID=B2A238_NATTJ|nr:DUF503 domain-containing protein [Natranaerobius thermophilus]ACB84843.1 protein of unknown function DUF503 [Natranaerobius thermophilus JW/NM-WN-LF]